MNITYRPIDAWPGERRIPQPSTFSARWTDTLQLLDRELHMLRAQHVVAQLAITERDCRLDGQIRADARPWHPGVILAFDSKHGPLKYATDIFTAWQHNVRAIALGLEALRKVDRYGITRRGEQYTGWKALGAGIAMPASGGRFATVEAAAEFLIEWGEWGGERAHAGDLIDNPGAVAAYFREAARKLHPDAGGDPEQFKRLTEARRMLTGAAP